MPSPIGTGRDSRHEDVLLAVVVQEMFPSEVSGVMFTANPVTSNPKEIFLNTSWGWARPSSPEGQSRISTSSTRTPSRSSDKKHPREAGHDGQERGGQGSSEVDVPEDIRSVEALADDQIDGAVPRSDFGSRSTTAFPRTSSGATRRDASRSCNPVRSRRQTSIFHEGMEAWQTPDALAELTKERWVWSRAYSDELQTGPSTPLMYTFAQPHRIKTKLLALEFAGIDDFAGYSSPRTT